MKTKFLIFATLLLIFASCKKEEPLVEYVIFSGKIDNTTEKDFKISGKENDFIKVIPIHKDGTFRDTLKIPSKGFYKFRIGPELSSFYLNQGDQLKLSIDVNKFDESIKYTGTSADENNYLVKKYLLVERHTANRPDAQAELYSKNPTDFKNIIQKQKEERTSLLAEFRSLTPDFMASEKKDLQYEYLFKLADYEDAHMYFTKKKDFNVPEGFLSELKDLDIDNAEDFDNSTAYKQLSIMTYNKLAQETAIKDSISKEKALLKNLSTIKSNNIKEALLESISYSVSVRNENATELYHSLMEASDNKEFKEKITKQFEKIKLLVKGNDSPIFTNYENYKGGTTSLTDYKGKYVYIDVWATWCGPCKDEIPHLKKIEKEYHTKNIEFISISVDKKAQHDAWKKMIAEKELGGVQLFADNNWFSQFVVDYAIQGIPRFILISPEGKIINASAPRPSDSKLIEVFNELKI